MGCKRRIDRALKNALQLPLNACSRYVIMSDCHRGEGTMNDNFLKNQNLYYAALNCYRERGFFLCGAGRRGGAVGKPQRIAYPKLS